MTYQDFKDYIYEEVASRYESRATVHLSTFTKNNGVLLDGLVICEEDSRISPNLYLNDYYDLILEGQSKEDVLNKILKKYEQAKSIPKFDPDIFSDFSAVKDKIIFRLINQSTNSELLEDVPYLPFLDLAIVFSVMIEISKDNFGTVLIRKDFLPQWNIEKEELFEIAKKNTYKDLQPEYCSIEDVVPPMFDEKDKDLWGVPIPSFPIYILSNKKRFHGAGVICYPEYLKSLAEQLNCDLYIIPSSVHEVLIVPMADYIDLNTLSEMVRQVNATEVPPEEVLSNHAYYFLRAKNQLQY